MYKMFLNIFKVQKTMLHIFFTTIIYFLYIFLQLLYILINRIKIKIIMDNISLQFF